MTCKGCGAELREDNRYCPYCGKEQERRAEPARAQEIHIHNHYEPPRERIVERVVERVVYQEQKSARNRLVMLLLCLFLGVFGVHRFYAGRFLLGVIFLLTGGGFGVGVAIDFLIILLGTPKDGKGLPIRW